MRRRNLEKGSNAPSPLPAQSFPSLLGIKKIPALSKSGFLLTGNALMTERNLSQAALAQKLFVDQTTVSAWLRGETEPALSKICLLLEVFQCKFEDLTEQTTTKRTGTKSGAQNILIF